ncbi:hypothetical protein Cyast_1368 [Cyanobacterium stanieri PCC 7202]|uniref:Uncharacterized protein n=1 Tax=Cyanobacterium stanieri (strain ATCC 29140 / PCC 7202) TaxID=292563 RepID=K9YMK2_CYASC|nr:hypothetical protein Cyast_1368 [Cyanobacterium stanieri PCC 7202]
MEAIKVQGVVNEQGQLIVEENINLSAGNVEIIILKKDKLEHIETDNKPLTNESEKNANKPIWEIAEELIEDVSDEDKARLPNDGAVEHDHYIYGTSKINK